MTIRKILLVAAAFLSASHSALALSVSSSGAVPKSGPALAARIAAGDCEVYGIVHWGLNTYTDREWGYGDEDPALLNPAKFDADQIVGACRDGGLAVRLDMHANLPEVCAGYSVSAVSPVRASLIKRG